MIDQKILHFQGKGTDLEDLPGRIAAYLESEGFTVQRSPSTSQGTAIQAQKGGILSGLIAADRALTIVISGDSADFTVRIGIGKWVEHLVTTAVETLLLSGLFLVVDVAEMVWTIEIEDKLVKEIEGIVG